MKIPHYIANPIRWIIFIPGAALLGFAMGAFSQLLSSYFLNQMFININGSLAFGVVFYMGGLSIAPIKNNVVKWVLLLILYTISIASIVTWFMDWEGADLSKSIPILIIALACSFINPKELSSGSNYP